MAGTADVFQQIVDFPAEKNLRVLGMPGAGKTSALLARYRNLVANGHAGRVFIVTYSRDQLEQLTGALLPDGESQLGATPVVTYYALARELLARSGHSEPVLVEGLEENLLVRGVLRDHGSELKSDFRSICDSERFQKNLLALFHGLLQNGMRGKRFERVRVACRDRRLLDVFDLYDAYIKALGDRVTYFDVAWTAAQAVDSVGGECVYADARVLLVDDFQDVDAGQFALLTALARHGTSLNVFGDPMGAYFAFRGTDSRYLNAEFDRTFDPKTLRLESQSFAPSSLGCSLAAAAVEVMGEDAKAFVPAAWFQAPRAQPSDLGPLFDTAVGCGEESVSLMCVKDEVAESYGAAAYVHDLIESGRAMPYDVAVVANEKHVYEPLLRAAFAQRGLLMDTGRLVQSGFRGFVHALLTLLETPDDVVYSQALTTSAFYPYLREAVMRIDAPVGSDPAVEDQVVKEFITAAAANLRRSKPESWITHIVKEYLMPASGGYEQQSGDETIYGFSSLLMKRWSDFVRVASTTGEPITFRTFLRECGLFGVQSTAPMPTAAEVGFYSAREMKGKRFPYVIVLGCSELMLPAPLKREQLMPTMSLQQAFDDADARVSVHGARDAEAHLAEQFHILYHVLTRASTELTMFAPKSFAGQARPAPSALLRQHLPADLVAEVDPRESDMPPAYRFARRWVESPAAEPPSGLENLSMIGKLWNGSPPEAAPFAIDRFSLSKSAVENYCRCPRQFYYRKVLRVDEDDTGALLVGNIYHEAMAAISKPGQSKETLHAMATDERIEVAIDGAMAARDVRAGTFFARALRFHVLSMVKRTLDADRRDDRDYRVEDVETKFEYELDGFAFNGRADRVERTASGLEVVDFKTGKNFPKMGKTVRRDVLRDLDQPEDGEWQVPIYAWGYKLSEQSLPNAFRHVVQRPGENPFTVTLFLRDDPADLPPSAESPKKVHNPYSYLLSDEIESIMKAAATVADAIFSEREDFKKTERRDFCRSCSFNLLCDRRVD